MRSFGLKHLGIRVLFLILYVLLLVETADTSKMLQKLILNAHFFFQLLLVIIFLLSWFSFLHFFSFFNCLFTLSFSFSFLLLFIEVVSFFHFNGCILALHIFDSWVIIFGLFLPFVSDKSESDVVLLVRVFSICNLSCQKVLTLFFVF